MNRVEGLNGHGGMVLENLETAECSPIYEDMKQGGLNSKPVTVEVMSIRSLYT